jgi:hypothetical protein
VAMGITEPAPFWPRAPLLTCTGYLRKYQHNGAACGVVIDPFYQGGQCLPVCEVDHRI